MFKDNQIPEKYRCSITSQPRIDPVIAADDHTSVPELFVQRSRPLTFLYSHLVSVMPGSLIGLIQEYYVAPQEVADFLKFVTEGEQDKAETMLKSNTALALVPGDVTDLSKRTFKGITGFQYAVWALDWHMWTMIKKYLLPEEAQCQAQGFETGSWVKTHGVHANLNTLIQAYQTTIDLYSASKRKEGDKAWVQQVGGAQLLLPAHVINEYCHPTRPFYPPTHFKNAIALPRSREIEGGEWFTGSKTRGKLGQTFACNREGGSLGLRVGGSGGVGVCRGQKCLISLTRARTAQREELITELQSKNVQRKAS